MRVSVVLLLLAFAALPTTAVERRLAGRAGAVDGDTLEVAGVRVRLQGVAAPELGHPELGIQEEPGGLEAAAFAARLVGGTSLVGLPW